eukprot:9954625-Lingulodinium_polyedra.AAC.1
MGHAGPRRCCRQGRAAFVVGHRRERPGPVGPSGRARPARRARGRAGGQAVAGPRPRFGRRRA